MSAASALPNWLLLEEDFVFERSFPDETEAPITIRASGTSSGGDSFRLAFSVAEPPQISRLYAQLPPLPERSEPLTWCPVRVVATHRHLALVSFIAVAAETPEDWYPKQDEYPKQQFDVQNFFILDATDDWNSCSSSLKLKELPACTEPLNDYSRDTGRLPSRRRRGRRPSDAPPRLLSQVSLGLWCPSGEEEEFFVVAELTTLFFPYGIDRSKAFADICLLRTSSSSTSSSDAAKLDGNWESLRVEMMSTEYHDDEDLWRLRCWETDSVVPFQQWLCWIDCHLGIIFCDMSKLPNQPPTISFLWFPLDELPCTTSFIYSGVSVVDHGRALKFVHIVRSDGIANLSAPKPGTGTDFTITCHTLVLGAKMKWKRDYKITSSQLWEANPIERLPRTLLSFPRVDIHRPQVLHLVAVEFMGIQRKMWVVSIDMRTKTVESCSLYMDGTEYGGIHQTDEQAAFILDKSHGPSPFLPCEFPKFLHLSRKSKYLD